MAVAAFNIPVPPKASKSEIEWENMDLESLPPSLAKQVTAIHQADEAIKAMKAQFAAEFNAAYSEPVPAGMVRRFSFKFDGLSFGNAVPLKGGKAKIKFTGKKAK